MQESEAEKKRKEELLRKYHEKKSGKKQIIAKSSVLFDVKPWDDETDMVEMERLVRTIVMDGLVWGAGKLVPLAYGIKKLTILCVVEDDKVSTEELTEKIEAFEDYVSFFCLLSVITALFLETGRDIIRDCRLTSNKISFCFERPMQHAFSILEALTLATSNDRKLSCLGKRISDKLQCVSHAVKFKRN